MEEIKRLYNAYVNSKDYAPYTEKSEQLHDRIVETLAEMLPNKEYAEVEENLSLYSDAIEESAFIAGFKIAVRMITSSIQK